MKAAAAAIAAVALVAGLAGCSAGPAQPGPLIYAGDNSSLCALAAPSGGKHVVSVIVTAPKGATITLSGVHLVGAQGMQLRQEAVIPIVGNDAFGDSVYPPTNPSWQLRKAIRGYEIPAGISVNIALVVERTGKRKGSIESVTVDYQSGGHTYAHPGTEQFTLANSC